MKKWLDNVIGGLLLCLIVGVPLFLLIDKIYETVTGEYIFGGFEIVIIIASMILFGFIRHIVWKIEYEPKYKAIVKTINDTNANSRNIQKIYDKDRYRLVILPSNSNIVIEIENDLYVKDRKRRKDIIKRLQPNNSNWTDPYRFYNTFSFMSLLNSEREEVENFSINEVASYDQPSDEVMFVDDNGVDRYLVNLEKLSPDIKEILVCFFLVKKECIGDPIFGDLNTAKLNIRDYENTYVMDLKDIAYNDNTLVCRLIKEEFEWILSTVKLFSSDPVELVSKEYISKWKDKK